jgi:hypothetical protein
MRDIAAETMSRAPHAIRFNIVADGCRHRLFDVASIARCGESWGFPAHHKPVADLILVHNYVQNLVEPAVYAPMAKDGSNHIY